MLTAFCRAKREEMSKRLLEARLKQCTIIQFLSIERGTADKIRTRLLHLYGKASYAHAEIYRWIREFQTEQRLIFDEPRSGRPLVVEWFPSDISSNSKYFCNVIVRVSDRNTMTKKIFLNIDNAKFHNSQTITEFLLKKLGKVYHSFYSLDIALNDFYFLDIIKQCLCGF
jgi:hypothetical protein